MTFRISCCNALIRQMLAKLSFSLLSRNDSAWYVAKSFGKALVLTGLLSLDLSFIILLHVKLSRWFDENAGSILDGLVERLLGTKGNVGLCKWFNWILVFYVCHLVLKAYELIAAVVGAIWAFHDKVIKCSNKNYFIFLIQNSNNLNRNRSGFIVSINLYFDNYIRNVYGKFIQGGNQFLG